MFNPNIKKDVIASIVVFLVAIPLSLGIAFASGAPIIAGIIAAAVGGIVAGALGGAPLQVSGPAAGLTVIVYGIVHKFGWPTACVITLVAGLMQIVLGVSKVARTALAISPAVVHGMLAGIGLTIAVAQFQVVLGGSPASSVLGNLGKLPANLGNANFAAVMLGALSIATLFVWPKLPQKVRAIPAPLVAILVPTLLATALNLSVKRIELPADLMSEIKLPVLPDASMIVPILTAALTIAAVASVESLLSAVATDKMHRGARANLDKELVGQGAANAISGMLGGLPVTGVIVRSSANIASGAQTRLSAILHGVWVLVFVGLFATQIQMIPLAALAGLLVHVGIKLINMDHVRELRHHKELAAYLATFLGVVTFDLIVGVGLGLTVALLLVIRRMATTEVRLSYGNGSTYVHVNGSLTFLNVPRLVQSLNTIPPREKVEVEIHTDFMDHAAFEALHSWEKNYTSGGGEVLITEPHEDWYQLARDSQPRVTKSPIIQRQPVLASGEIL